MNGNGSRRPPRPHIEMLGGNPSEEEGAAIVTALERFLADTAPEPAPVRPSRWQQAALREGLNREPAFNRWTAPR